MKIYKNGILWFEVTSPDELIALSQTIANNLRNNYFTNVQTMNLIATARSLYQVAEMPETPTINTIYYVGSTSPYNVKLVDSNGTIVDLGSSTVDLSNFYTKAESDNRYLNRQDFLNTMYPKGSIYITYENKNPSTFLGGTWVLIGGQDANLNYYPAFAISTDTEGSTINESLPNITGVCNTTVVDSSSRSGAITKTNFLQNSLKYQSGSTGMDKCDLTFNASGSSPVYQDNAHVNVNAIKLFFWRRIDENNIGITLNPITISTNIDSSSTNTEMAGAKAVYDAVSSISEPKVINKTYNSTYIRESYGRFIAIGKILIAEIGLYVKTKIPANTVFCEITSDITVGTGEWYGFLISDSSTFTEQKTRVILSSSSKKIKVKGIPIPEGWWFGNLTILLE